MNRHLPVSIALGALALLALLTAALLVQGLVPSYSTPPLAGASTSTQPRGASESTHEVADWMNTICPTEDSTNCWWSGGGHSGPGPMFVRQFPGRAHMICFMFADHPRRDYCIRNR